MTSQRTPRPLMIVCAVMLASASLPACDGGSREATPAAGATASEINERFQFVKGRDNIVRIDTSSGRTWRMPISADGGWTSFGAAREDGGFPQRVGRYVLSPMPAPGGRLQRGAPDVQLLLLDRDTGRSWLALDTADAQWAAIGDADASAPVVEHAGSGAAGAEADGEPAPEASPTEEGTLSYEGIEFSVPEEKVDVEADQARADVEVLVMTLEKEGLPSPMRLWAIGQLGRYPAAYAVAPLLGLLDHEDPAQVAAAIESLAKIGDPSVIPEILRLRDHPSPVVQDAVRAHVTEVR